MTPEHFLFTEKYRPRNIEDTILPERIKTPFREFVENKNVPNLLLSGGPGVGKTTCARAMLEEIGCNYIMINGSMNGNIDTMRNDVKTFASTVSFTGGRKYVIFDEAENISAAGQASLKAFMEEYSKNCGFIFTCNNKNKIIEPIHSRCSVIDFKINKTDMPEMAKQFFRRCSHILTEEGVEFDKAVLAEFIKKYFPDFRRILNEIQLYSSTGKIDSGILSDLQEVSIKKLMQFLKDRNFSEVRKWAAENSDVDVDTIFRKIYDNASTYIKKNSVPALVLIIGKYQYQHAFVASPEINLVACLTEIMMECDFE